MQDKNKKASVLGVLGGLGPMATVYFYELVTVHTLVEKDQDHLDIVISSKASTPDRTAYILGKSKQDPFGIMEKEAERLVAFGADVIAIPCNTAHYFYSRLTDRIPVPVLNMVGDTVDRLLAMGCKKAGILATDGTIQTGTYQRVCQQKGLDCAVPNEKGQREVMSVIYNDIKTGSAPDMDRFFYAANQLITSGCDYIILACTELSLLKKAGLLSNRYLDSMQVLAESAIHACGKPTTGLVW